MRRYLRYTKRRRAGQVLHRQNVPICLCAVNVCMFQRVQVPPGKGRLPGSNRSGGGGNEPVEAFGGKDRLSDSAKMQAATQVKVHVMPRKDSVDADLPDIEGRPERQGKVSDKSTLPVHRGRGQQHASKEHAESTGNRRRQRLGKPQTDGPRGSESGRQRWRRGSYERRSRVMPVEQRGLSSRISVRMEESTE
jgi:hypothetical protein